MTSIDDLPDDGELTAMDRPEPAYDIADANDLYEAHGHHAEFGGSQH